MILPDLTDHQLAEVASAAEVKIYRLLRDQLPDQYSVLFQAAWILSKDSTDALDGETDFIICHPNFGYIALEVKGGGIAFNSLNDTWTSTDKYGNSHPIKDPIKQAMRAKYCIHKKIQERGGQISKIFDDAIKGHAVYFPDIAGSSAMESSDRPRELIGTSRDNASIKAWVENVFKYWERPSTQAPGSAGIALVCDTFARTFDVKALTSSLVQDNEASIINLTSDQINLLNFIGSHRRATIHGGAGTGKTVLAVEKAKTLAREGNRTLLTCYNRPLADFLSENTKDCDNLSVLTIHQLAHRVIEGGQKVSGRNLVNEVRQKYPNGDLWDVHMPLAMWDATEFITTRFDAMVCDEAQDFPEDFWMPLQNLLSDFTSSPLYVFRDDNQNVYGRNLTKLLPNAPFQLTKNCRNSSEIHSIAYARYEGSTIAAGPESGIPVKRFLAPTFHKQSVIIVEQIRNLLKDPGLLPGQITVLISTQFNSENMKRTLAEHRISKSIPWTANVQHKSNEILIETVKRFKGLESSIVLLWIDDANENDVINEELYIGASRARSNLFLISTRALDI